MPALAFSSLDGYQKRWLRPDLLAGLTVWAVLVPEALARRHLAERGSFPGLGPGNDRQL